MNQTEPRIPQLRTPARSRLLTDVEQQSSPRPLSSWGTISSHPISLQAPGLIVSYCAFGP